MARPGRRSERRCVAQQLAQAAGAAADELAVPDRMEVGTSAEGSDLEEVAALVAGQANMQRLVDVADQVDDVLQRHQALCVRRARLQDG